MAAYMCMTFVKRHVSDVIALIRFIFTFLRLYIVRFSRLRPSHDSFEWKPIIRFDFAEQKVSVFLIGIKQSICAIVLSFAQSNNLVLRPVMIYIMQNCMLSFPVIRLSFKCQFWMIFFCCTGETGVASIFAIETNFTDFQFDQVNFNVTIKNGERISRQRLRRVHKIGGKPWKHRWKCAHFIQRW